jgi:hypothetical protein
MARTLIRAHMLLTQSATQPTVPNGVIAVEEAWSAGWGHY